MTEEQTTGDEYVDGYVRRKLAVKALRRIRGLVDGYDAEERRNRRLLKVFGFLIFAMVVFTVFYIASVIETRELDASDQVIVPPVMD